MQEVPPAIAPRLIGGCSQTGGDGFVFPDHRVLLLTIFSATVIGPDILEFIRRKGDSDLGAGNFRALPESIEQDQISRSVPAAERTARPSAARQGQSDQFVTLLVAHFVGSDRLHLAAAVKSIADAHFFVAASGGAHQSVTL